MATNKTAEDNSSSTSGSREPNRAVKPMMQPCVLSGGNVIWTYDTLTGTLISLQRNPGSVSGKPTSQESEKVQYQMELAECFEIQDCLNEIAGFRKVD